MLAEQGALNAEDIEDSLIENIDDLAVASTSASSDDLAVPSTSASTDNLAVPSTSASTEDADTTPSEEEAEVQEISQKRKRSNSSSDSEDDTLHEKTRLGQLGVNISPERSSLTQHVFTGYFRHGTPPV